VFELCQVAVLVTVSLDPSDFRAVAVMFDVEPTFMELDPETATDVTVTAGAGGGEGAVGEPHADKRAALNTTPVRVMGTTSPKPKPRRFSSLS
jgi:hypothetical protein